MESVLARRCRLLFPFKYSTHTHRRYAHNVVSLICLSLRPPFASASSFFNIKRRAMTLPLCVPLFAV